MMRKTTRARRCAFTLAVASALAVPAMAAEDGSPSLPASRKLVTVPADLSAGSAFNFIGVHGTPTAPQASGLVTASTATTVTVDVANKANSIALDTATLANKYVLRVEGKSYKITGASGSGPYVFTVAGNPSASSADDYAEVVACPTLETVFGADNKFGLDSDNPLDPNDGFDIVFASVGGAVSQYKFVGAPINAWATAAGATAPNVPLNADGGYAIQTQAGSSAALLPVSAIAHTDNHVLTIVEGVRLYSWPYAKTVSLNDSGLGAAMEPDNPLDPNDTFDVLILESAGATAQYKFVRAPINAWATAAGGAVDGDATTIDAGSAFMINRPPGGGETDLAAQVPIED